MTTKDYEKARALIDLANEQYGDLPDGAYWAACEEMGAGMHLQMEVEEYEQIHGQDIVEYKLLRNNKGPFAPF